jgi:hypothetical protein
MAITPGSDKGNLNSTTEVELVPAPGAGVQRAVTLVNIYNKDTAASEYIVSKKVAGTLYEIGRESLGTLVTGRPVARDTPVYLTGTDQSIVAVLAAVITTTQPRWNVSWIDKSQPTAAVSTYVPNEGPTNGVTPVTAISAPAAGLKRVIQPQSAGVRNYDVIDHIVIFQKNKAGVITIIYKEPALAPGDTAMMPKWVGLDATDESLEIVLGEVKNTTEPKFDVVAQEVS